jgi:transcriptional regulator with XRE-family HTH domain
MNPILDRLFALMEERGIKAKQVTTDLNLSNSSFTDWRKGKGSPGVEALTKMAEYFGVSLDYLILGKESESDFMTSQRALDFSSSIDAELIRKFNQLPAEYQSKVLSYIDGMLAVLPPENKSVEKLLG